MICGLLPCGVLAVVGIEVDRAGLDVAVGDPGALQGGPDRGHLGRILGERGGGGGRDGDHSGGDPGDVGNPADLAGGDDVEAGAVEEIAAGWGCAAAGASGRAEQRQSGAEDQVTHGLTPEGFGSGPFNAAAAAPLLNGESPYSVIPAKAGTMRSEPSQRVASGPAFAGMTDFG